MRHLADGLQTLAALPLLQPCFFNPTHLVLKMREGRLPLCLSVLSEFHTFEKKKHIFNSRKSCGLSTLLSVKTTNDRRDEVVLFKTSHRWPNYVEHRHSRGCLL